MATSLAGKVAIVTGASSGIGWAVAKVLAAGGCRVGLLARREGPLQALAAEISAVGGSAAFAVADVADRGQVGAAVATIRQALGPIDLMVANAGVGKPTTLDPVNISEVETMIRVNLLGVIYAFSAVMPEMLARKTGRLVAVSSIAGYRGLPGESAYCASKAAVNVYLDGLRIHLRGTGLTVTTICPGFVTTPMTADATFPMPWLMDADAAARKIVRAIKAGKKVYNFPQRLHLLSKLSRWLPDRMIGWFMGGHDEAAKKQTGDVNSSPPASY